MDVEKARLDPAPHAVITIDSAGSIVEFNPGAESMFGYAREAALGKRVDELIEGSAPALDRQVQQRATRRGGEQFPVELTVSRTSASPPLYTWFVRDLTGPRRAEEEATRRAQLLAAAEELVHMGTWELELGTGRTLWSDELFRIHGLAPGDIEPSIDLMLELAHPEDRQSVSRVLTPIRDAPDRVAGTEITLEYRVVLGDGSIREVRASGRVESDEKGQPARWMGSALDLTELRLTERELQAHAAVGNALRYWASFDEEGVDGLLRRLGTALDFPVGCMWSWDPAVEGLRCRAFWSAPGVDAGAVAAATLETTVRPGEGVAGRAWEGPEPVFSEDVSADPGFTPSDEAPGLRLRSGLAFAAVTDDEPLAVLAFYSSDRRVPSKRLIGTLGEIGRELGRFFGHHRSELEPSRLSDRELEVLRLAAHGNTGPAIAERLGISPSTVKSHFENIYVKLDVSDRTAAVAEALRAGLIS